MIVIIKRENYNFYNIRVIKKRLYQLRTKFHSTSFKVFEKFDLKIESMFQIRNKLHTFPIPAIF